MIKPLLAGLALATAACTMVPETAQQAEERMKAESDSLRPVMDSAFAAFNRQYNAAHIDSLMGRYADRAVIMPPNGPHLTKDSLRTLYVNAFQGGSPNGTIDVRVEHIARNGPLAVVRARWTFVPRPPSPMPADTGSSLTVWYRTSDGWKIFEDIWHSDRPAR